MLLLEAKVLAWKNRDDNLAACLLPVHYKLAFAYFSLTSGGKTWSAYYGATQVFSGWQSFERGVNAFLT